MILFLGLFSLYSEGIDKVYGLKRIKTQRKKYQSPAAKIPIKIKSVKFLITLNFSKGERRMTE